MPPTRQITVTNDLYKFSSMKIDVHISRETFADMVMPMVMPLVEDSAIDEKELVDDCIGATKDYLEDLIKAYEPKYLDFINRYSNSTAGKKIAFLFADGMVGDKPWTYHGNMGYHTVQSWIDRNQKDYSVLIIGACNPEKLAVDGDPLIVFPDDIVSYVRKEHLSWSMVLHMREITTYTVEYELAKLARLRSA